MISRVHVVVEGLVQGVGYRWYTARQAESLGLWGFVRNRVDGSVEIEAEGERSSVEALIAHARVGPRSAQVRNLHIEWITAFHTPGRFEIR